MSAPTIAGNTLASYWPLIVATKVMPLHRLSNQISIYWLCEVSTQVFLDHSEYAVLHFYIFVTFECPMHSTY